MTSIDARTTASQTIVSQVRQSIVALREKGRSEVGGPGAASLSRAESQTLSSAVS